MRCNKGNYERMYEVMKKLLIFLLAVLFLMACGKEQDQEDTGTSEDETGTKQEAGEDVTPEGSTELEEDIVDYPFIYNGVTIHMDTDVTPVLVALGEPLQYFEAESCAFKGLDKTYYYSGFELTTYPKDADKDYISSLYFKDDSVSTPEGVYIGSTVEDMIAAYGEGYTGDTSSYTYTKGESSLMFVVENDEITAITYLAVLEELQ